MNAALTIVAITVCLSLVTCTGIVRSNQTEQVLSCNNLKITAIKAALPEPTCARFAPK